MISILSFILFLIFSLLSGIHFYWLFGGNWGLKSVIPSKGNDPVILAIPKFATILVALGLLFFGLIYLNFTELLSVQLNHWLLEYGMWFIPSLFLLRAIGEFNYVGVFKRIKNTSFAKADNQIFIPLCASIGIIGLLIQLNL
jgi:hypothetical protein